MKSAKEQLEEKANNWIEQGKSKAALLDNWQALWAICWLLSPGAKNEQYSENLAEFIKASKELLGSRWDDMLRERDYCNSCGESYKIENLSLCCCGSVYCYRCLGELGIHANGNRLCRCGSEVVG